MSLLLSPFWLVCLKQGSIQGSKEQLYTATNKLLYLLSFAPVNIGLCWYRQTVAARGEKWPGGLRNFISGWTYRIVVLPLAVYNDVSSHSSRLKLIKLVIFSCPYWYVENIHFSLIKPNPNHKHEHKRINPTGPIKNMTHNQCHQSISKKLKSTVKILKQDITFMPLSKLPFKVSKWKMPSAHTYGPVAY